jgi:hypothetical protein
MQVSVERLQTIIGRLTIEVDLLTEQNSQLNTLVEQLRETNGQQKKIKNSHEKELIPAA